MRFDQKRREFISLVGGAMVWPLAARAQQAAMPVIGLLGAAIPSDEEVARNLTAFRHGLAETGYVEGQNVRIEYRWAAGNYERLPALAAELVALDVNVIVNEGGAPSVLAAIKATSTVPIVFHTSTDPVADGWVASLARPGSRRQHGLRLDPSIELLVQSLDSVCDARTLPLAWRQASECEEPTVKRRAQCERRPCPRRNAHHRLHC